MAAFDSFVSGIGAGQALRAGHDARSDKKRKDEARRRMGQYLMGDPAAAPMPQPPMPGQPSVPSPGGVQAMPQMMGAGGAPVMPPSGGMPPAPAPPPQPPQGMGGPPQQMPMPGATPMPQPPQAPPMPMAKPQVPAGPDATGAASPAGPEQSNPFMDSLHTLRDVAQAIKAANPGITPEQLADATSEALDSMKGVSAETLQWSKALLGADTASNRDASAERRATTRADAQVQAANIRAAAARDVSQNTVDWHKYQTDSMYKRAIDVATIGANSRIQVGAGHDTASNYRADRNVDIGAGHDQAAVDRATEAADASDYKANLAREGSNDMARGRAGQPVGRLDRPFRGRQRSAAPIQPPAAQRPPVPNARKAPDGNWYVPDPQRPGKYLKVG